MTANWWTRFIFYIFCVVLGFMFVLPTMGVYEKLPSFLQKVFPSKSINLGLDLRGGMHLLLEVETDKALVNHMEIQGKYFLDAAKEKKLPVDNVKAVGTEQLEVFLTSTDQLDEIKKVASDYLGKGGGLTYQSSREENGLPVMIYGFNEGVQDQIVDRTLSQSLDTVRNRVDAFGVAEPSIQRQGKKRLIIQLPGLQDPARAKRLIGKTAQLVFKLVDTSKDVAQLNRMIKESKQRLGIAENDYSLESLNKINKDLESQLPKNRIIRYEKVVNELTKVVNATPFLLEDRAYVTGDMIEDAYVTQQRQNAFDQPRVILKLNNKGAKAFASVTGDNVGRLLAIVLDDVIRSAPRINERIPSGDATITMGGTNTQQIIKDAKDLSLVLKAGALPAPIVILEERTVGPSLGEDSIMKGKRAIVWGAVLVIIFMIIFYRFQGGVATLSIAFNVVFILAVLSMIEATLTLPGIAGIALTIGMAVDCNIIVNERIKEELRTGKTIKAAIASGYENSFSAIFDANTTTLIAAIVLMQYGSGPIKGFSVTLLTGILATLFTSYYGSKIFNEWLGSNSFTSKHVHI